jgi:lipid II:glycine glycyltransferase (peptidoglycan interpeptide bridge formation enzyme)
MPTIDISLALGSDFSYALERLAEDSWHGILEGFQDASVFQTTAFCAARASSPGVEHMVVRRGADVVAAAQIRLIRAPVVGKSVAYILWGPMCRRWRHEPDWGAFCKALRALRHEYVVKRGLSLRIAPPLTADSEAECRPLFDHERYVPAARLANRRTIVLDVERPLDEIRKGLDKKWRNCLNRAEANNLELREGCSDAMFDVFLVMYREMLSRKRLAEPGDIRTFRAIQSLLPARLKMNVIVAFEKGEPSAGAICSAIGRRGLYLFGATANSGMQNKASYLVQWRAVQWLKDMGCAEYDLHGSNPRSNPGVYAFKMGLCGRNGKEVDMLGPFDAYEGLLNRLVLTLGDRANQQYKALMNVYGRFRGFKG